MARSMSIVEYKIQQAHFFLEQVASAGFDMFAAQCFVDAYASAARSITFSMQAVMSQVAGFREWYAVRQEELRGNPICSFFNKYRRISVHIGDTMVQGGTSFRDPSGRIVVKHFFFPTRDLPDIPERDVLAACSQQFRILLELVLRHVLSVG